ncbi:MAG: bifunctional phosphoribosyl-AMP cyclohydrolase/phosphoribosyl-ATP pyrophosphatase [Tenericutes bacterium HGW-Tenericutes-2]|jgi:phosphoribosyl-ATP pyrophosphohydrolase/phosphoribosyl-AMP cyclohydrolase|nr:MAG: bifunctional phosphoribosyl-AMP cyclohydrolase/phosphoribosyl-ATP pyrophosphatase [Tenericutes bacterium HGW-Tenericutes-2]
MIKEGIIDLSEIKFDENGLIPVVVQSIETSDVLMLAYMNKEALDLTIKEGVATYYSRSRKSLWKKGETSGHYQYVKSMSYDCDGDSILLQVIQVGVACHTNKMSCFFNEVLQSDEVEKKSYLLEELYATIDERKKNPLEGSYTNYLFTKGLDKILKKVGEETAEVIIAAKNKSSSEMIYEISDLVYHTLVLMVNEGIELKSIEEELKRRQNKK